MTSTVCEVLSNKPITKEFFILQFSWGNPVPKAGQFFMIKPVRSSVFLPRPISIFEFNSQQKILKFLIAIKGRGTQELAQLQIGDKVILTGPGGNAWTDFMPENGKAALVGGSAGIAPLCALVGERPDFVFHLFAGFRQGFRGKEEEDIILGCGVNAKKYVITAEDGRNALIGRITDFIYEPESYDVILGCGPIPMLNALKKKCAEKNVPCFLSLESRFACGIGACLGCTIKTVIGNRCCCKHGPIFPAGDIIFDE
ncbi:MAG: dihydroorotate dehydrogenase electron transfer subunit [Treponema sp.]|nr:dihydroorotate dehydrogenase electron transfer subunit [Treponema sp.]